MKDRCDWMLNSLVFRQIQPLMGAVRDRPVCISPDKTITLELETGSRGRKYGCIQPGLVQSKELCQSSMVLDSSLADKQSSKGPE